MKRLILDTETTDGFKNPKVYDLGGIVVGHNGRIIEQFDFVIEEIFYNDELMQSAYYIDKLPQYYAEIENGTRTVATFAQARGKILNLIKKHKLKKIYAYNCSFDKNALNSTCRFILNRDFIPNGMKKISWHCIMGASLSTICQTKKYIENAPKTPTGRVSVSAENVYRYVIDDSTFEEAHTGLADALIEWEILKKCLSYHRKLDTEPKMLQSYPQYWEIQHKSGWGMTEAI